MDKIPAQPDNEKKNTPKNNYRLPVPWLLILLLAGFFSASNLDGQFLVRKGNQLANIQQ